MKPAQRRSYRHGTDRGAGTEPRTILALVQETPEFALHIMAILANRIRKMNASL